MLGRVILLLASATVTSALRIAHAAPRTSAVSMSVAEREKFWIEFEIPKKGIAEYGTCQAKLAPLLEESECVTIETQLPFGLSAEPVDGRVVVTQDGAGGERVGDVLRFFSGWKQGPGGPMPSPDMVDVDKVMHRTMA